MHQREGRRGRSCTRVFIFWTECPDRAHQECVCVLTLCSLSLRAGTPFADARAALRVSQEQAAAEDSQRSC